MQVPRSTILYCFLGSLVAMVRVEENQVDGLNVSQATKCMLCVCVCVCVCVHVCDTHMYIHTSIYNVFSITTDSKL